MRYLALITTLLLSINAHSLTIMEIDTSSLWDHKEPHEGNIFGNTKTPPTKKQYTERLQNLASLIIKHDADVISLTDIEGCHIALDLAKFVNRGEGHWRVGCSEGRDVDSGKDVAVLTKFKIAQETVTTFPEITVKVGSKKVRPSKIVGFLARDSKGVRHIIIAAQIDPENKNEMLRHAEEKAIYLAEEKMFSEYKASSTILLSDLSNTPERKIIKKVKPGPYDIYKNFDLAYLIGKFQ
jgi:hypothetical protein